MRLSHDSGMDRDSAAGENSRESQDAVITGQEPIEISRSWDMIIQSPSAQHNRLDPNHTHGMATATSTPRSPPSPLPGMGATQRPLQQRRTASASQVPAL